MSVICIYREELCEERRKEGRTVARKSSIPANPSAVQQKVFMDSIEKFL